MFGAVDAAFGAGWRRCKLYFMIGLPTETDDDIKGIASLVQRAYDRAKKAVPVEQRGQRQAAHPDGSSYIIQEVLPDSLLQHLSQNLP